MDSGYDPRHGKRNSTTTREPCCEGVFALAPAGERPDYIFNERSIFPNDPSLRHFQRAGFDEIRDRIASAVPGAVTDIATIWGTPSFTGIAQRGAFRPDKGSFRGTETDGNDRMPYVGFWLSKPGDNRVYLVDTGAGEVDQTLINWFQSAGIGGAAVRIRDARELTRELHQADRRVYACDNYGEALDGLSVNTRHDFDLVSSKSWTKRLVGSFAPYEESVDMFTVNLTQELFDRVRGNCRTIYVKLCNDEHGGMGVKPVRSLQDLKTLVADHQEHTRRHQLSHELILQRGVDGVSRSFCFFIDGRESTIPVLAVTDQVVDPITGRDLGNRHYPIVDDVVRPLIGMISELRTNILTYCPNAFGLVMCDFIQTQEGHVVAIDPGLRPSASTPSAMAQLWMYDGNHHDSYVRNNQGFRFHPGFTWDAFTQRVGSLADPAVIMRTGVGVVPFSWEPLFGTGRTMTIAKSAQEHDELLRELERLCGAAFQP